MPRRILVSVVETETDKQMSQVLSAVRPVIHMSSRVEGVNITDLVLFPPGSPPRVAASYHNSQDFEDVLAVSQRAMGRFRPHCRKQGPEINGETLKCMRKQHDEGKHLAFGYGDFKIEWS